MSDSSVIDRLLAGHRALETVAARLSLLLTSVTPDLEALATARWEFATRLMQHLAFEDRHVYANLAASLDATVAAVGRKYQADYAAHLASYETHARQWTSARVAAEWATYRVATRKQLELLQVRIDLVERELYPLAFNAVSIAEARSPSRSWAKEAFGLKASIAP